MNFYSTNINSDIAAHNHYMSSKEVEEMMKCIVDGDYYPLSEMINDEGNYFAKININEYLKDFERDMLSEDFKEFKNKLIKQL